MARRKKQTEGSGVDPNSWMVTFSDLVTLLLTFFVMLISMSSMDTNIVKSFFTIFKGASGPLEFAEEGGTDDFRQQAEQLHEALVSQDTLGDQGLTELLFQYEAEKDPGVAQLLGEDIEVEKTQSGLRVRFKDRVMFDAGSAELLPDALPLLRSLVKIIAFSRFRVSVEGHTDNIPLRTQRFSDNWTLSLARAIHVVNYFTEEVGLSANRFRVGGYGSSRPLVPNDSLENRRKNRRIEIFLYTND